MLCICLWTSACASDNQVETAEISEPALFTDITESAGLSNFKHETGAFGEKWFPESMGSGCGFIDFDGDGLLDILLAGGGAWPQSNLETSPQSLWLYKNMGDGTFEEHTAQAGLDRVTAYSIGFAVADYDNDGDQDFYLTTLTQNLLFRNDGGTFSEVSEASAVAGESAWSTSAVFFDADRDGWLDLYAGNYVEWTPETDKFCTHDGTVKGYCTPEIYDGVPGRFYRNRGDGTFEDLTESAGFSSSYGMTLGLLVFDFNKDGWPDLMMANDTQPDELYVNNGDGTFTERGAQSGIAYDEKGHTRAGMGIDSGVVDDTGEETIFVGNFSREMIGVYRHNGKGYFYDRAAQSRIGRPSLFTLTFGLLLHDFDLDGDLDLFAANGHVQPEIEKFADNVTHAEPPHLFMNDGNGIFEDIIPISGSALTAPLVARGAAAGDIDNDGDIDLLIAENSRGARLWRNETNSISFLKIQAIGSPSNLDGLGVQITAYADSLRMERYIRSGSSYLSASELAATFGLGARSLVDSLVVRWPSGSESRYVDLNAGQVLVLNEGEAP